MSTIEPTVDQWADRIRRHLVDAVENIVAAGRELIAAKEALPHGQFGPLLDELGLSRQMANRFMRVARNPVITSRAAGGREPDGLGRMKTAHAVGALPAAVSVLDELARLPDDALRAAIDAGEITPSTTRQQAAGLVSHHAAGQPGARPADEHTAEDLDEREARGITRCIVETDAGLYGPPIQVRDSQLDTADALLHMYLDCGLPGYRALIRALNDGGTWRDSPFWPAVALWIATLDDPNICEPWTGQLAAGDESLLDAARAWIEATLG